MNERPRVLAIDYGSKRIGLAISDELKMLARPIGIILQSPTAISDIMKIVEHEHVGTVILGLPRSLEGSDTDMTREVRTFAEKLFIKLDAIQVAHIFYDERLTSIIAESNLIENGVSKSKRRNKALHDEEAARIILQEYLNSQS